MDDREIIALFFARSERAIRELDRKHGGAVRRVASNILADSRDAEECVSDTWLTAWRRIPPAKPQSLRAFLGKITRTLAISRWRSEHAKKRGAWLTPLLSELDECLPAPNDVEEEVETRELARQLSNWLRALPQEDCRLFLWRYWYGVSVKQLARVTGCTENQMAQRMRRLRLALRVILEQEGINL